MFKSLNIATLIFMSAAKLMAAAGTTTFNDDVLPEESQGFMSHEPNQMSSNWLVEVRAALPARDFTHGTPDFGQITNLLCEESARGNNMALGLWGGVVVGLSQTPDEVKAGLQMMQTSAQNGYVLAMVNLGVMSETGRYFPRNYDQAFYWFGLAATNGSAYGELQLGACYHYGFGTRPDSKMAASCYLRAAEMTNYVAMKSYGYYLSNGIGVKKDLDAARYWLTRAAKEGGNRRAMYDLGVLCESKFPDTNAMAEAFQWYQQSAEPGDALGCSELANCYYNGWGTSSNLDSYHLWLYKAAALGATDAQYRMGVAYRTGDCVPQDTAASLEWYWKAAAKNHPEAYYDLAIYYLKNKTNLDSEIMADRCMLRAAQGGNREAQYQCALSYLRGDVAPPDCDAGNQWMAKAANNGWAKAEFALFEMYYHGMRPSPNCQPYPEDKTEALKWLHRAADHGDFQAQATLAVMLIQGMDMGQNVAEAEKLLRNAANHGYVQAQNDLGYSILHGDLGSTDWVEAAMWCQLAETHWNEPRTRSVVEANLSNALAQLTSDQEQEVEQRVKNFHPLPVVETWPLVKDWEKNPAYQQEDGRHGH
jgi:TPR repeat protein